MGRPTRCHPVLTPMAGAEHNVFSLGIQAEKLRLFGFRDQSMRFRTLLTLGSRFVLCCLLCASASVMAQKRVSSERESRPELGDKPDAPLKVETIKGTLKKIDLEKRTVTIAHGESESVFGFPTAAGREKITLSKKVAKTLGKKSLRLEEVQSGSQVKVAYYPALGTIMELTIEELGR